MKKIGITGGIGSGKSTVCRVFRSLGFRIYEADAEAKRLMVEDDSLVGDLKRLFGDNAYLPDGSLNRSYLGQQAFQNPDLLQQLNELVHPRTRAHFDHWVEATPEGYPHPFVLKEAAILYESGAYRAMEGVITVYAPKRLRLQRVMQRDQASEEAVQARMDKQWPEARKCQLADVIIYNDGTHHLIPQVLAAMAQLGK